MWLRLILRQVDEQRESGLLAVLCFYRRGHWMSAVQIPLLADADQAAGQNVDRQSARDGKDREHQRKGNRHELHHHLLLRIGGGHWRHFRHQVH